MQIDDASMKIARLSTEAARNYASAAFAAYADFAAQSMTMWAQAVDTMLPKPQPEPRSWYRPPVQESSVPTPGPFGWPVPRREAPFAMRTGAMMPTVSPFEFWQAWLRMWPVQGTPASWPMAFMLIQAGWPRDVAYPTAMGNAAMLEAVGTAAEIASQTFASYQTDSGHAAAHVTFSSRRR